MTKITIRTSLNAEEINYIYDISLDDNDNDNDNDDDVMQRRVSFYTRKKSDVNQKI